jgi:hypothetical protein
METAELEFPPIADVPAAATTALAKPAPVEPATLKSTVLAQFAQAEAELTTLAAKYANVAYDVSKPRGMKEAKAARLELREGRYAIANAEKRIKAEVNDLKRVMSDEVERLSAIVKPAEDAIHAQIEAEEKRIEAERQRKAAEEAARRERLQAGVAKIYGYVKQAQGLPAERVALAVAYVEGLTFSPDDWQEFHSQAVEAQAEALTHLRNMHAQAVEAERIRAENERLQAELAAARAVAEAQRIQQEAEERQRLEREAAARAEEAARAAATVTTATGIVADAKTGEVLEVPEPAPEPADLEPVPEPAPEPEPEAAPAGNVTASEQPVATINLTEIREWVGFAVTQEFLSILGVESCGTEKRAILYPISAKAEIKAALIEHLESLQ